MQYYMFPGQYCLYRKVSLTKHFFERLEFDGEWHRAINLSSHAVPYTLEEFLEGSWRFWFREHWNTEGKLLVEDYYRITLTHLI